MNTCDKCGAEVAHDKPLVKVFVAKQYEISGASATEWKWCVPCALASDTAEPIPETT